MQENNNNYVSSRGILKSCDYHSQNPQSSIRVLHKYLEPNYITNIKNPSIYICSRAIPHFIRNMLPTIKKPFILVSGDCDETIPNEILSNNDLNNLLQDKRLIHWFCQNMTLEHNKITKIPIGLDYHTLTQRPLWGPISSCQEQEKMLQTTKDGSLPFWSRNTKCYANFHFTMNTKLGYDRKDAYSNIDKELVYYEKNKVPRNDTWNKQKQFAFAICPHGGGLDCHRNWEALILGCIPIVKTSHIDNLYADLPVLIVKKWEDIDIDLLNNTIRCFKNKFENNQFNYSKLYLNYWCNLINSYK